MFTFLVCILCCVQRPGMTDEYFGAVEKKTQLCTLNLTCVCSMAAAAPSPSHFVFIGQVAQMLNQHFHPVCRHPGPVRPGRWTQWFVPVRCTKQTVRLFKKKQKTIIIIKCLANVNSGSGVFHTSLGRPQIYVCTRIRLVWPSGAPSAPNTSPGAW